MRIDTTRMSTRSPPADRRTVQQRVQPDHAILTRPSDLLRHPHDLDHLGDRVHADDVGAAQDGGGHGGGRAQVALGGRAIADRAAQERLPRRSDEHGPAERRGQLGQAGQHTIAVRRTFGKPDARVDDEALERRRRRRAARRRLSRSSATTSPTTSPYTASASIVFGVPRACISTSAAPRSATTRARSPDRGRGR